MAERDFRRFPKSGRDDTIGDMKPNRLCTYHGGIGPAWGLISALGLGGILAAIRLVPAPTAIDLFTGAVGWAMGGALLTGGVATWIWARVHLSRADAGQLATTGPFGLVRHPHYAAGLWLLGPGAAILLADWLALLLPLWMGTWLVVLLPAEEARLARRFGAAWESYAAHTPRLLPFGRQRDSDPEA